MAAAVKQMRGKGAKKLVAKRRHPFNSPLDRAKAHEVVWSHVSELFDAARRVQDTVFVYFIGEEDDGPVKVGLAKDPVARLRAMQTGNPRRLRIERVLLGDMRMEKLLHELWEPFAIVAPHRRAKPEAAPGTEWFRPEVRERLYPIVETACCQQTTFVQKVLGDVGSAEMEPEMERIVRDAHAAHDFVFRRRDEVRLLRQHLGYVLPGRRSRV